MDRRRFLAHGAVAAASCLLPPGVLRAQPVMQRFADMHAHIGFRPEASLREAMSRGPMLLVAEKITPDGPLLQRTRGRLSASRAAKPGELRRNFEVGLRRRMERLRADALGTISSVKDLDQALEASTPAVVLAAEGADFLEGELGYLDKLRVQGLVHLQLVHYYTPSAIGDISTEPGTHGGLSAFGKELVKTCNRLGMLVDVAHCTTEGIEQALAESNKPIVYSHGQVSANPPHPSQSGVAARAIYAPLARRIAERGGVVGLWPLWSEFANLDLYADELIAMTKQLGAQHVGIGTDINGLPRSVIPGYAEFGELPKLLTARGLIPGEIDGIVGGNYIRVLRQALAAS